MPDVSFLFSRKEITKTHQSVKITLCENCIERAKKKKKLGVKNGGDCNWKTKMTEFNIFSNGSPWRKKGNDGETVQYFK